MCWIIKNIIIGQKSATWSKERIPTLCEIYKEVVTNSIPRFILGSIVDQIGGLKDSVLKTQLGNSSFGPVLQLSKAVVIGK